MSQEFNPSAIDNVLELADLLLSRIEDLHVLAHKDLNAGEGKLNVLGATLRQSESAVGQVINATKPINKLPPEILGLVFSFVPTNAHDLDCLNGLQPLYGPLAIVPTRDLSPILHVCHYWRDIAMNTQLLWSAVQAVGQWSFRIHPFYDAPDGPLYVDLQENDSLLVRRQQSATTQQLSTLQTEGHRVYELRVSHPNTPALVDLLSFPAPELRVFKLSITRGSVDLPSHMLLFNAHAPRLRALYIDGILSVPTNSFPSLTHLIITSGNVSPLPFTCDSLFGFLAECPNLLALHLSFANGKFPSEPSLTGVKRFTPRILRKFSYDEPGPHYRWGLHPHYGGPAFRFSLLSHLQFPADCLVRLSSIHPGQLTETMGRFQHGASADPFTCMRIGTTTDPSLATLALQLVSPKQHQGIRIDFSTMVGSKRGAPLARGSPELAREYVADVLSASPLFRGIRHLWIGYGAAEMLEEPHSILWGLPHLTTLLVDLHNPDREVAKMNWRALTALEVRPEQAVACPQLDTLVVCLAAVEQQVTYLFHLLASRRGGGHPVRRLVVAFQEMPNHTLLGYTRGLHKQVEEFRFLGVDESLPDDLRWTSKVPYDCRGPSETHVYWPVWS